MVAIGGSALWVVLTLVVNQLNLIQKNGTLFWIKTYFSMNALAELFKAILKSLFVGLAAYIFLWHNWNDILHLITLPPLSALANAMQLLIFAVYIAVLMLIPMVAFDIIFQIRSHLKKLRMTRQELKMNLSNKKVTLNLKHVFVSNNMRCLAVE
nr:EscU/YscU/HrcU family type III secretion system export apparatus switch protein [Proteus hauseri]